MEIRAESHGAVVADVFVKYLGAPFVCPLECPRRTYSAPAR